MSATEKGTATGGFTVSGKRVTGKLARMRKAQTWTVLPMSDSRLMVQSDRSIGCFDFRTGRGRFNTAGCYFPHLAVAAAVVFPADFVTACLQACPPLDSVTVTPTAIINNTVEVF